MKDEARLIYADKAALFYAKQYGIAPMAGRLLGYLSVCEPERQSINKLAEALKASRSAIVGAVQVLENAHHIVSRTRAAGQRSDLVGIDAESFESGGFEGAPYRAQAMLFREGLELLGESAKDRRAQLEELARFAEFLAERLPELRREWDEQRRTFNKNSSL